jgi:hypothetical protein
MRLNQLHLPAIPGQPFTLRNSATRLFSSASSTSTPSAAAASTTWSAASKKQTFLAVKRRNWDFVSGCGERGHLIKNGPKSPKNDTGKGPESNAVAFVNSGAETDDLETESRDKSRGAYYRPLSRGSGFRSREQVRGMYPSKNSANHKSERDGPCSYSSVVANNSVPNSSARSVPGPTVPTINVVPKANGPSESL